MGSTLMFLGFGLFSCGWLLFRKDGIGFWTSAPIWRASDYVKGPGPALWISGYLIGLFGIVVEYRIRGLIIAGVGAGLALALALYSSKQ